MKPLTPIEVEALRRRWQEILKQAQEKGEPPGAADIQAANISNDPFVMRLLAETEEAREKHKKRRLDKLKINPEDFKPANRTSSALKMIVAAEMLTSRNKRRKP